MQVQSSNNNLDVKGFEELMHMKDFLNYIIAFQDYEAKGSCFT